MKPMKTPKDLRPLIDGDFMPYRYGFSADAGMRMEIRNNRPDVPEELIEDTIAMMDYESHALHGAKLMMEGLVEKFNPEYRLYLQASEDDKTFRYRVASILPYKGNRVSPKPKYHQQIREYLFDVWKAIPVRSIETDDAIGIEQYNNPDKTTVLVSQDKDLKMIPGWHFDPVKEELYYQNLKDANNWLFYQMLVGDKADNIPGIKGMGDVRTRKMFDIFDNDTDRIREAVKERYQDQYGTGWETAYQEVGTLLWIMRKPEDLDKGCPLL